jgi:protein involved in polysaccharide export with SLBB domain
LLQGNGGNGIDNSGLGFNQAPVNTNPMTLLPSLVNNVQLPQSRLEQIMSQRAGAKLSQFGYDLVGTGQVVTVPQVGAVADGYILGAGDQLNVSFRGQENSEYTVSVSRNGTVVLPRMPPILAAGHTLSEFRDQLSAAVKRAYVSTQAFVSIGQLRQISVIVAGEVYMPGTRLVTGLSTPLDAILLSGGVKKTGSLRSIILERGGRRTLVDLYDLLTQRGSGNNPTLSDGDKIIVPPIGRTVAVTGWVRRPGIYELAPGTAQVSTVALLKIAGGLEVRGSYRLSVLRIDSRGGINMTNLPRAGGTVHDSEILFVQPAASQTQPDATLAGGTPLAGQYSAGGKSSLAEMLKAPGALGSNPYSLFGIVSHRDPATLLRTLVPITPIAVVHGSENMTLEKGDIVRVFSQDEIRLLTAVVDAFRLRRQNADIALRAPTSANLYNQSSVPVLPQNGSTSSSSSSATAQASSTSSQNSQQTFNANPNAQPNTERQDIAELSVQTLGDGGVLTNNPPTNGYTSYSSVPLPVLPGQSGSNQTPQTGTSPSSPGSYGQSAQSIQQQQQFLLSQQQMYQGQQNLLQPNQDTQNLPPNLQQQQIVPGQVPTNEDIQTFGQLARQLTIDPLVLVHFLMDHALTVDGAVHGAGTFFVGPNVSISDLVTAAGGAEGWADVKDVELTTTMVNRATSSSRTSHELLALNDPAQASRIVRPRDEIRLHQIDAVVGVGSVTLQGEVRYPGTYQIQRGERLSELLLRAGGLTDVAYPYGTVFLRKSAADIERQSYIRAARDLETEVVAGMTAVGSDKTPPTALAQIQSFIQELRTTQPLGRVSIVADPALLASNPSRDVLLEAGDVIYVPQRSSVVSVMGEVLQPGAFPFSPKMDAKDYIARAGGYGQLADSSMTFIVFPDGTARQLDSSWLNLDNPNIPPGSTIVVPRDASILATRQIILDITSIFRDLAVGAASLAVISRY